MAKDSKRLGKARAKTVEFWYRRKYSLTSNDPRFLDATPEEMLADYWAHHYFDNPKLAEEVEDEDFDLAAELAAIEEEDASPDDIDDIDDFEDVGAI